MNTVLRSASRLQWAVLALALTLPLLLVTWYCWHQRTQVLENAKATAARSVVALEQHASNVLDVHTLLLRQLDDLTRGKSGAEISADLRLREAVTRLTHDFPQISVVGMADKAGVVWLNSIQGATGSASVADRDYFLAQKNSAADGLYVSEAFTGRLNGARQFSISLRRVTLAGDFDGILYATVPLNYFTRFWEQFTPSAGHLIPLVRSDGALIARYPLADGPRRLDPQGPYMTHIRQAPRGLYTSVSQVDGVELINAYSQVKSYPLYISFSVETALVLREWRHETMIGASMGIFTALTLAALWLAVVWQSHGQRLAAARWRVIADDLKAEVQRREAAEAAMRQSQKMEAVGQLAGGIAHDFNNLLGALAGNVQLMRRRLDQGLVQDLPRYLDAVESITTKAGATTQRLLAFSRRQTLAPMPLDVNERVEGMRDLILQTVGRSVRLRTVLWSQGRCATVCDPSQLDNALLNLAINARDAMSEGGDLTITTSRTELTVAQTVALQLPAKTMFTVVRITDTGAGMAPELIERVFEPFFTTKPIGLGTGLGLSMVHGFVLQSGGNIEIKSQVGIGTEVAIYLPAYDGQMPPSARPHEAAVGSVSNDEVCVLLVDDEVMVREPMAELLAELGYRVLQAGDGAEGIAALTSTQRIDLLISDVGLSGPMNGQQLAEAGRKLRPELKVLIMTGNADYAAIASGTGTPDMEVMFKPFGLDEFQRKVSAMTEVVPQR